LQLSRPRGRSHTLIIARSGEFVLLPKAELRAKLDASFSLLLREKRQILISNDNRVAQPPLADVADAMQNITFDMDSFSLRQPMGFLAYDYFAFSLQYPEYLLSFVFVRFMRPRHWA